MRVDFRRFELIGITSVAVLAFSAGAAETSLPSIQSFFSHPNIRAVALSPSGDYLAVNIRRPNGRMVLGIASTASISKVEILESSARFDIVDAVWINDQRLYYKIANMKDTDDDKSGEIYAINRDGNSRTQLISYVYSNEATGSVKHNAPLEGDFAIRRPMNDDSDDVLVGKWYSDAKDGSATSERLYRMNTKTIRLTDVLGELQPKNVHSWVFDRDNQPRFAESTIKDRSIVYYRSAGAKEWVEVANAPTLNYSGVDPSFMDGAGRVFAEKSSPSGTNALYLYDTEKRTIAAEPFFETPGFDVEVTKVFEPKTKRLLGLHYESDAKSTVWFDENLKAIQKTVDETLANTINQLDCRQYKICLVKSHSDRDPGRYWLYNVVDKKWSAIGPVRNDIDPEKMARRDFFRIKARDGLEIPVYVTTPLQKSNGPRPTVVLVHGGPKIRGGHWEWNAEAQFLASRGYLVLEPDYRGSDGYGSKHRRAGWKQWGLAMQDDLADTAKWAIAQGWADKRRIGIAGASYGGYATLMGLIKQPEIFRCGVSWAGVTDINLMYSVAWSDASDAYLLYNAPTVVGDPIKDAEQLRATSPLLLAAQLTHPLLMGHGTADRRVPLVHGTKFRDAVAKHNQDVEWVSYNGEGHGWMLEATNLDWWTRVEAFLEKNLKSAP